MTGACLRSTPTPISYQYLSFFATWFRHRHPRFSPVSWWLLCTWSTTLKCCMGWLMQLPISLLPIEENGQGYPPAFAINKTWFRAWKPRVQRAYCWNRIICIDDAPLKHRGCSCDSSWGTESAWPDIRAPVTVANRGGRTCPVDAWTLFILVSFLTPGGQLHVTLLSMIQNSGGLLNSHEVFAATEQQLHILRERITNSIKKGSYCLQIQRLDPPREAEGSVFCSWHCGRAVDRMGRGSSYWRSTVSGSLVQSLRWRP